MHRDASQDPYYLHQWTAQAGEVQLGGMSAGM
jgi:hypothetical protein